MSRRLRGGVPKAPTTPPQPRTPGQVGKIRELTRGIEAEVCVGVSGKHGYTVLKVLGTSEKVRKATEALREALREEAHESLIAAQEYAEKHGKTAVGR